jgi:hypothetical protein
VKDDGSGSFQGMRPQHAEASGFRIDRAHCQLDSTGQIAVWPPEAEFISGTRRLDVEGKTCSSSLRGESEATLDLFLARGSSLESLLTFRGHWEGRWLDLSVAPFLTSDGKVLGYIVWMQTMIEQVAPAPDCVDLFDATSWGGQSASLTADLLVEDGDGMLLNCAGILRRGMFTQQDAFLQKPFTPSSLVRRIQELIQASTSPMTQSK